MPLPREAVRINPKSGNLYFQTPCRCTGVEYLHGTMLLLDLGEILIANSLQCLVFEIFPGSNNKKKKIGEEEEEEV